MTRPCATIAIAVLAWLSITGVARGGTYEVQTCKEDVRAPIFYNNWTLVGSPTLFRLDTNCSEGPTRLLPYGSSTPQGAEGGIRFLVNAPLVITGLRARQLIRARASRNPPNDWWWDFEQRTIDEDGVTRLAGVCPGYNNYCDESYGGATIRDRRFRGYEWVLRCSASGRTPCADSEIRLLDATFTIEDPADPKVLAQPTGEIFAGTSSVAGLQTVGFEATDAGSGVHRAVIEIDGAPAAETAFADEHPTCRAPFTVPQPCPSRKATSMTIDTTRYVDGQHQARLLVSDATGTNTAVYGPVSFTTRNQTLDSYCSSEDPRRLKLLTKRRAIRFGSRSRVRASVAAASGWEALLLTGSRRVTVLATGSISTQGRFEARIRPGTNRTLRLAIRPPGHAGRFICSAARKLRVRARVSLRVSPRRALNGRAITILGRLRGRESGRKALIVQARALGSHRWATVRVLRTRPDGAYRMRYQFRRTFSRVTYVFRTQVRAERGYPYATGYSGRHRVRVTG